MRRIQRAICIYTVLRQRQSSSRYPSDPKARDKFLSQCTQLHYARGQVPGHHRHSHLGGEGMSLVPRLEDLQRLSHQITSTLLLFLLTRCRRISGACQRLRKSCPIVLLVVFVIMLYGLCPFPLRTNHTCFLGALSCTVVVHPCCKSSCTK